MAQLISALITSGNIVFSSGSGAISGVGSISGTTIELSGAVGIGTSAIGGSLTVVPSGTTQNCIVVHGVPSYAGSALVVEDSSSAVCAYVDASGNFSGQSVSALTSRTVDFSATSAIAPTISGTSGRFVDFSATSAIAPTISGTSGSFDVCIFSSTVNKITTVTAETTLDTTYNIVITSGANVILPNATTCSGQTYTIKNVHLVLASATPSAGQFIDGQTQITFGQYTCVTVISNGTNWFII